MNKHTVLTKSQFVLKFSTKSQSARTKSQIEILKSQSSGIGWRMNSLTYPDFFAEQIFGFGITSGK